MDHSLDEFWVAEASFNEFVGREVSVAVDVERAEDLLGPRLRVLLESIL